MEFIVTVLDLIHELAPYIAALSTILAAILGFILSRENTKNKKVIDEHSIAITAMEKAQIGYDKLIADQRLEIDRAKMEREHQEQERASWVKERDMFTEKCAKFQEDIYRHENELENLIREKERFLELEKSFDIEKDQWTKDRDQWASEKQIFIQNVARLEGALAAQSKAHNEEMDRINLRMIELDKTRDSERMEYKQTIDKLQAELEVEKSKNEELSNKIVDLQAQISSLKLELDTRNSGNTTPTTSGV